MGRVLLDTENNFRSLLSLVSQSSHWAESRMSSSLPERFSVTRDKLSEPRFVYKQQIWSLHMANPTKLSLFLGGGPCHRLLAAFQLKSCEFPLNWGAPKFHCAGSWQILHQLWNFPGVLLDFHWQAQDGYSLRASADVNCFILPDVWDKIMHQQTQTTC